MKIMEDIHNSEQRYEQNRQKLENSDKVSLENKEAIQRFIDKSFAEGISKTGLSFSLFIREYNGVIPKSP